MPSPSTGACCAWLTRCLRRICRAHRRDPHSGEKEELDAAIAQAREALGNEAFDAAWAAGGGLSLDQAVELSLTVTASPAVGPDPT
jgi:hypothetical protein